MFDRAKFEQSKHTRDKFLMANKLLETLKNIPVSPDDLDFKLQIQHLKSIIGETDG